VANDSERGLLGIALSPNFASDSLVYTYHTAATADGGTPISNKISRYRWTGTSLVFDRKIADLPPGPGPNHDGGKILFDQKGKLMAVIGDLNRQERTTNFENSGTTNRVGAILRMQPSGKSISTNPFASVAGAQDIYAYGVRNSFGIAIDPLTGALWDTENGPNRMDEINLVSPGFNSGWRDIMGPRSRNNNSTGTLVNLGPRAFYSDPEFSWAEPVAPTDLHFFDSSRLGNDYANDLFVGDVNSGSIFHFDLAADRRSLVLSGALADRVADNSAGDMLAEQQSIVFGEGFGIVSDLLNGPGGLFALSLSRGRLYRISQNPVATSSITSQMSMMTLGETMVAEPTIAALVNLFGLVALRRPGKAAARRGTSDRSVSSSPGCRG
jgi:aldose sugar dehydrogenase